MFDDGLLQLCSLDETAERGAMPAPRLRPLCEAYYATRTIGYNRFYAAMGANQQIDLIVRTWYLPEARIGMYAVLEDETQYRIDNVQHLLDDDGLRVTDLTMSRLEDFYDVAK